MSVQCLSVSLSVCVSSVLCSTVKELVAKLAATSRDDDPESVSTKCSVLNQKLNALITTLHEESQAASQHTAVRLLVVLFIVCTMHCIAALYRL